MDNVQRATISYDSGAGLVIDISVESRFADPSGLPYALAVSLSGALEAVLPLAEGDA